MKSLHCCSSKMKKVLIYSFINNREEGGNLRIQVNEHFTTLSNAIMLS